MLATAPLARVLVLLVLPGLAAHACGDDDARVDPGAAPDEVVFDVTWKPTTIVVDEEAVSDAIVDPFAADGVYRFRSPPASIAGLAPDQIVVLSGVGLFRVLEVTTEGEDLVVRTEEAALVDAAERGRIEWDVGIRWDQPAFPGLAVAALDVDLPPGYREQEAAPANGEFTFGRVKAKFKYSQADGTHKLEITLTGNEGLGVNGKAEVSLRNFRQRGVYEFVQSQVNMSIGYDSFDISGTMQFDLKEVNGAIKTKRAFGLVYPFMLGPIPAYVQLGIGAEIESTIAANGDKATALGSFGWSGSTGIDVIPGISQTPHASAAAARSTLGEATFEGKVSAGATVNFDAPRIDFGVGLVPPAPAQSVNLDAVSARASLFLKAKSELVANWEVYQDLLTGIITGYCFKPQSGFGLFWGGEVKFFSFQMATEQLIYGITKEGKPEGNNCAP